MEPKHVARTLKSTQPQGRLIRNHVLLSLCLTLLISSLAFLTYQWGGFSRADNVLYDKHFQWRGPDAVSGKVSLVLLDQDSSEELGRKRGFWSRKQMARALENLCAAGAEVIGLDMVFFAPAEDPSEDLELAAALEACSNVVLAWFVATEGRGEVRPLPVFQDAMIGDGFVNMVSDRDGVLRKIPFLSIKPADEGIAVYPSFSLEMVRAFMDLDFSLDFSQEDHFYLGEPLGPKLRLPYPDLRINYAGGAEVFTRLSYADVVKGRFPTGSVKGRIVLIGSVLATDKDFFTTPFSAFSGLEEQYGEAFGKILTGEFEHKTPGVACHANAIETILNDSFISRADPFVVSLLIFLAGLLGLLFYPQRPGAFWGFGILVAVAAALLFLVHRAFVNDLVWVEVAPVLTVLGAQYVAGISVQRAYSRKRARMVTGLFGKYVSQGVVDELLRGDMDISLEGRSAEVTVLFTDLRGFTSISENLTPQETSRLLNNYFDAMIPAVFRHGGTLDKLMGDAVMAFFGAPGQMPDHATNAALTAMDMKRELKALRERGEVKGVERLAMGVGLNSGQVTAGNLGSRSFMDYTVIGDTVNLASRLEGLNKHYGTTVIMSGDTAKELDERFLLRELDRVRVKGKDRAVAIYELAGLRAESDAAFNELIRVFEEGLALYRGGTWAEAEEAFNEALKTDPEDEPSRLYLRRISSMRDHPLPADWDGVTVFDSK